MDNPNFSRVNDMTFSNAIRALLTSGDKPNEKPLYKKRISLVALVPCIGVVRVFGSCFDIVDQQMSSWIGSFVFELILGEKASLF